MQFVAGQQDAAARAGRAANCNTEAVMSACSKAFEIIQVGKNCVRVVPSVEMGVLKGSWCEGWAASFKSTWNRLLVA